MRAPLFARVDAGLESQRADCGYALYVCVLARSGASAVLGFVGATSQIWRWSKTAPLVITGAVIAPVTAFLVVEDVSERLPLWSHLKLMHVVPCG